MKKLVILAALFSIMTSACSNQGDLTRIDVERYNEDRVFTIMDSTTINTIKSALAHVKWSPNVEVKMARREDVAITLFYQFDKNMPERLYTHKIWFNDDGTAIIISDNEKEGYGTLNKNYAPALKVALFQHGDEEKAEGISLYKLGEESVRSIISDKDAVETINNAIKDAVKQPGIVNMADPQYKIMIGNEIYFLWLTKTDLTSTIMNFKDTHTIYTMSEYMTKKVKSILLEDG